MTTIKLLLNGRVAIRMPIEDLSVPWALSMIDDELYRIKGNCAVLSTVGNLTRIHRIRRAA